LKKKHDRNESKEQKRGDPKKGSQGAAFPRRLGYWTARHSKGKEKSEGLGGRNKFTKAHQAGGRGFQGNDVARN